MISTTQLLYHVTV